jgi:hypothetical protein
MKNSPAKLIAISALTLCFAQQAAQAAEPAQKNGAGAATLLDSAGTTLPEELLHAQERYWDFLKGEAKRSDGGEWVRAVLSDSTAFLSLQKELSNVFDYAASKIRKLENKGLPPDRKREKGRDIIDWYTTQLAEANNRLIDLYYYPKQKSR